MEDGETRFHPIERAEHRVLGFERSFTRRASDGELALSVELYRREVRNPRPRYENLFEPLNTFPEVEPDRVRVTAQTSVAEGVEIFLRGTAGRRVGWWVNYAYATSEDEIDGRWVPRLFDQRHTLNLNLDLQATRNWRLNAAWRFHTGRPTTPLALFERLDDEGEPEYVPVLGAVNSERLPSYHRLDLRASRSWRTRRAEVAFFVDVQNLYNRKNHSGFDFEIDDEEGLLVIDRERWSGFFPSAGISIEF